ncbi:MAG: AraC family transcriptional regulator [Chloroflexaceae bacterium]|nr:AraC family transcriptional regulator [Chloroflexaceae bacterium]NJO05784.1 AraC family transcriptional regulator [Chloroflexaceae bacterium]
MDTLKQFNLAMQYIETHLDDEIDIEMVARVACCSAYHFRRMFASLAGMSLRDYIRRRRLSQAALHLRHTNDRVIDVAVWYGYGSADAFSRAFAALHGVTPSKARLNDTVLKVIPPMTFQLTIRGGDTMDYRIIEKAAFSIVGVHKQVRLQYHGVNPEIAALWASLTEADIATLEQLNNEEPSGLLNASANFTDAREEGCLLDQYIGVVTTQAPPPGKWAVLTVPALTWVVFPTRGKFPDALQDVWGRIYAEWLATSGYELADGPELLWTETDDFTAPDFHAEIWIPIVQNGPPRDGSFAW